MANEEIAISIILMGLLTFFTYVAKSIKDRSEQGELIQFYGYLKMFVYAIACLTAFISVLYIQAISDAASLALQVTAPLATLYQFIFWSFIIMAGIFLFGIVLNIFYSLYIWAYKQVTKR